MRQARQRASTETTVSVGTSFAADSGHSSTDIGLPDPRIRMGQAGLAAWIGTVIAERGLTECEAAEL